MLSTSRHAPQNASGGPNKGFTIVELLVVIVVIAILAAISIVAYAGIQERAKESVKKSDLQSAAKLIQMFGVENSHYPINHIEIRGALPAGSRLTREPDPYHYLLY